MSVALTFPPELSNGGTTMVEHFTRWPVVEGYTTRQSYVPGEVVDVHCSSRAGTFSARVERVGLHRGLVWQRQGIIGADHAVPDDASTAGCGWPVEFSFGVEDWPSGYYEITFSADGESGEEALSQAFFVVRAPPQSVDVTPAGSALLVLSTNTYNAYNQWGGSCLYSGSHRVSFARPIERGYLVRPAAPHDTDYDGRMASVGSEPDTDGLRLQQYQRANRFPLWSSSGGWHNWERRFVRWAEASGISLHYAVNSDLQFNPEVLDNHKLMLSVGHDEYWSWAMRDRVDDFVETGGSWGIFSGNTCFWQVRYEDDGLTMVSHKGNAAANDPVMGTDQQHLLTAMWPSPLIGRPENRTTGLSFSRGGYARVGEATPRSSGGYTVHRPDHWAFAGTGLRRGDVLGGGARVVGYEVDGCALTMEDGLPIASHDDGAPADLQVLASAPARLLSITAHHCEAPEALWASIDPPGDLEMVAAELFGDGWPAKVDQIAHGHAVMGSFTKGRGTVFNAGSTDWAFGLDDDPLVQQVTRNVVRHLAGTTL
ncbi:MAG: N,N-dimethylformamidase beta subunit family domain-containing protein [Acidimicrobiales bacterium]